MTPHAHIYRPDPYDRDAERCLSRWGACDAPTRQRETPWVAGSSTSQEAARAIAPVTGTLRARVLVAIRQEGGVTDEEGMDLLEMPASTYRPRRVELVRDGLVRDSGQTRDTKSGRKAVIWVTV